MLLRYLTGCMRCLSSARTVERRHCNRANSSETGTAHSLGRGLSYEQTDSIYIVGCLVTTLEKGTVALRFVL